jgi:hypothetical protein
MPNPKPPWNLISAGVPLVLTFANAPAATRYECQNRGTDLWVFSTAHCLDDEASRLAGGRLYPAVRDRHAQSRCRIGTVGRSADG